MLGQTIADPDGIEGPARSVAGLGHLDVATVMQPQKRLALSQAIYRATGDKVSGYEIHMGDTTGPDCARAWLSLDGRGEGAASADGRVMGCYLHGLFSADAFRTAFFDQLGKPVTAYGYEAQVAATLDALADHLEQHMDLDALLALAGPVVSPDRASPAPG
jgi:adenosylcobyric acid synthase